jgi:hypothetical protein
LTSASASDHYFVERVFHDAFDFTQGT